jgi:hypothetical protein
MVNKFKKSINFQSFVKEISGLKREALSHVDPYYQKIDLHFGKYTLDRDGRTSDYVLYVSGFWEVLYSGETKIDETHTQKEIVSFFNNRVNNTVVNIQFFEESLELFLELSSKYTLHFQSERDGHWIELLKRNGELLVPIEYSKYSHKSRI